MRLGVLRSERPVGRFDRLVFISLEFEGLADFHGHVLEFPILGI
jgi:hypothetical protein